MPKRDFLDWSGPAEPPFSHAEKRVLRRMMDDYRRDEYRNQLLGSGWRVTVTVCAGLAGGVVFAESLKNLFGW